MSNWTAFVYIGGETNEFVINDNALVPIQEINFQTEEDNMVVDVDYDEITLIVEQPEEFTLIVEEEQSGG